MQDVRSRLSAIVVGGATTLLLIFAWLANTNPSQRPDVFYLDVVLSFTWHLSASGHSARACLA